MIYANFGLSSAQMGFRRYVILLPRNAHTIKISSFWIRDGDIAVFGQAPKILMFNERCEESNDEAVLYAHMIE